MENMFSGYIKKEIPKNLAECTQPDSVSTYLWTWSERIEQLGAIFLAIIIIVGFVLSITGSLKTAETRYGTETEFHIEIFIVSILTCALYAFIEYCAFHVVALLIGALASIVQNTRITARVALLNSAKEENKESSENGKQTYIHEIPKRQHTEWSCPNCGRKNTASASFCKDCGTYR